MGLIEEVQQLRQQGYTEVQIKNFLTQKGYSIEQIAQINSPKEIPNNSNKKDKEKKIIKILALILILAVGFNIFYFYFTSENYYSNNPKKWVDDIGSSKILDVKEATRGGAYVDNIGEQQYKEIGTMFSSEGWYKGEYFIKEYIDENNILKIKITNNMTPNDGVLEGYLVERMEEEKLYAYVFLDSDWKEQFPNSEIYWGGNYQNNITFDFENEVSKGIFLTKIEDDMDRFKLNFSIHQGGFYIGDLREDELSTILSYS